MHFDISSSIVIRLFEMAADVCLLPRIFGLDGVKMCLNPVHTPKFSLSHILHFIRFTRNAINDIQALASDILTSNITAACVSAGNST